MRLKGLKVISFKRNSNSYLAIHIQILNMYIQIAICFAAPKKLFVAP
jgi:hypothetical protein